MSDHSCLHFFNRVLSLNKEEVEEIELPGFDADKQTSFCCNVSFDQLIQVILFKIAGKNIICKLN